MFLAEHLLQDLAITWEYIVRSYISQVSEHRSHPATIFNHDKLNNNLARWLRTNYNMGNDGTFFLQIAVLEVYLFVCQE